MNAKKSSMQKRHAYKKSHPCKKKTSCQLVTAVPMPIKPIFRFFRFFFAFFWLIITLGYALKLPKNTEFLILSEKLVKKDPKVPKSQIFRFFRFFLFGCFFADYQTRVYPDAFQKYRISDIVRKVVKKSQQSYKKSDFFFWLLF